MTGVISLHSQPSLHIQPCLHLLLLCPLPPLPLLPLLCQPPLLPLFPLLSPLLPPILPLLPLPQPHLRLVHRGLLQQPGPLRSAALLLGLLWMRAGSQSQRLLPTLWPPAHRPRLMGRQGPRQANGHSLQLVG